MTQSIERRGAAMMSSADARGRLLEAAVESFAAKGFHGTSTRDIAAAAGMSPAALYVHHRSKEDLLYLISRDGHDATLRLVRKAAGRSADPVEQLAHIVAEFTAHHARNHTRARIVSYELEALSEEHREEITAIRRAIVHEVRSVVRAGIETGVFNSPDAQMTTLAILSLGIDVARWFRDAGSWTPQDVAAHYRDLALRMVGADSRHEP